MQLNSSSTGGALESFPDAEEQANQTKAPEATRAAGKAGEEAAEAGIEDGRRGSS
jgi:hypothetical protein